MDRESPVLKIAVHAVRQQHAVRRFISFLQSSPTAKTIEAYRRVLRAPAHILLSHTDGLCHILSFLHFRGRMRFFRASKQWYHTLLFNHKAYADLRIQAGLYRRLVSFAMVGHWVPPSDVIPHGADDDSLGSAGNSDSVRADSTFLPLRLEVPPSLSQHLSTSVFSSAPHCLITTRDASREGVACVATPDLSMPALTKESNSNSTGISSSSSSGNTSSSSDTIMTHIPRTTDQDENSVMAPAHREDYEQTLRAAGLHNYSGRPPRHEKAFRLATMIRRQAVEFVCPPGDQQTCCDMQVYCFPRLHSLDRNISEFSPGGFMALPDRPWKQLTITHSVSDELCLRAHSREYPVHATLERLHISRFGAAPSPLKTVASFTALESLLFTVCITPHDPVIGTDFGLLRSLPNLVDLRLHLRRPEAPGGGIPRLHANGKLEFALHPEVAQRLQKCCVRFYGTGMIWGWRHVVWRAVRNWSCVGSSMLAASQSGNVDPQEVFKCFPVLESGDIWMLLVLRDDLCSLGLLHVADVLSTGVWTPEQWKRLFASTPIDYAAFARALTSATVGPPEIIRGSPFYAPHSVAIHLRELVIHVNDKVSRRDFRCVLLGTPALTRLRVSRQHMAAVDGIELWKPGQLASFLPSSLRTLVLEIHVKHVRDLTSLGGLLELHVTSKTLDEMRTIPHGDYYHPDFVLCAVGTPPQFSERET